MQESQVDALKVQQMLTARQVQNLLHIDRSTIYRMAEDGRLPAIRVGRQWRFPEHAITDLLSSVAPPATAGTAERGRSAGAQSPLSAVPVGIDSTVATIVTDVASALLGVMMVVTDMDGNPVTPVVNPCPWFQQRLDDSEAMSNCVADWRRLADDHEFTPSFRPSSHGFECARAFVRSGRELVGMVIIGGIAPADHPQPEFTELDAEARARILAALPVVAQEISKFDPVGTHKEEFA